MARKLVEGEKCPVCGSLHHPEPAKLLKTSISEEDFKRFQEEESQLQEKKGHANTEAEKAKTSLEEFEGQLRNAVLDCIENPILDMDGKGASLEELIEVVKEAKTQVQTMAVENTKKCNSLAEDCRKLKKAEKELETAQGEETEKLNSKKEELDKNKQRISQKLTEISATLKVLEELSFPNWETAQKEREQAETKKNEIKPIQK